MSSVRKDESMPPNDRLKDLQLHMPELFEHVSLKGFKRLIAQVCEASDEVRVGGSQRLKIIDWSTVRLDFWLYVRLVLTWDIRYSRRALPVLLTRGRFLSREISAMLPRNTMSTVVLFVLYILCRQLLQVNPSLLVLDKICRFVVYPKEAKVR